MPVKITDKGIFEYTGGETERKQIREGKYYSLLSIDPTTRNLLKEEVYLLETDAKVATYTYEYENTPGVMSKVDLPVWYYAYRNHMSYWDNGAGNLYFNYSNNLVKKIIDDDLNEVRKTVEISYEYNQAGFPVRMICENDMFEISY